MVTIELESLVILLEDWAKWQASYRPKTGFKSRSAGFACVGISSVYDMEEESDHSKLIKLDTAIDDLEAAQRAAINRQYGVCSVFRFPRNNYEQTLVLAHERLVIICKRKGIVL